MEQNIIKLKPEQCIVTEITGADIYLAGGRILRKGNVSLTRGRNRFYITGLSQTLEPESIQLEMENIQGCHISGLRKFQVEKKPEEETQLEELKETADSLRNQIQLYSLEMEAWKMNTDFTRRSNITLEETMHYLQLFAEKAREISASLSRLQKEHESCLEKCRALEKALQKKKESQITNGVYVELYAQQTGTFPFEISYFETAVSWKPFYDIRMTDVSQPLRFSMKAKVTQYTGEDWKEISLKLFYGNVNRSNNRPVLAPCYLDTRRPAVKYPAVSACAAPMRAARPDNSRSIPEPDLILPQTTVTREMMMQYELPGNHCLEKGSLGTVIDVLEFTVSGSYHYYIAPKAEASAFLTARVEDVFQYDLLPCSADLYLENTYMGKMDISDKLTGDDFWISLGRDRRIKVARKKIRQYRSTSRFKGVQTQSYEYEIFVQNLKDRPAEITILDQIPVSRENEIIVEVIQTTGGIIDSGDGTVSWNLTIEPGGSTRLVLAFSISYPRDKWVNLNLVDRVFCDESEAGAPPVPPSGQYCKSCGRLLQPGIKFCVNCGSKV